MTEASPPPPPEQPTPQRHATDAPRRTRQRALLTLLAVAIALVLGYLALESARKAKQQEQLAEVRAREAAEATARAQASAQQAQEAQKKLAEMEQAAAEVAVAELPAGPGRDDALLLEVERLVMLAMNDLQLTRQPATALAAFELADARLAAANDPRWVPLRRALARDIERLRALPAPDVTGSALKLDQLIAGADVWPLANAPAAPPPSPPKAAPRPTARKAEAPPAPPAPPPPGPWQKLRAWLAAEFGDLLRINEVGTPEALLLSDEQGKLVRSQLKLRLLGARLALLARNDKLYQADIDNAQTLLALYFDARHAGVTNAAATLRQLRSTALSFDVPALADSQAAVRAARAARARR
jgi:uroporphyrinogen III methyltransferase/synthase